MSLKSSTELTATEAAAPAAIAAFSTGVGRRRLLRAGLAATPVILAVSGRSAMASTACPTRLLSPMAWNSLAAQGFPTECSHTITPALAAGQSPGDWMPNGNNKITTPWPTSCVPFAGYVPGDNSLHSGNPTRDWPSGTKFGDIFTGPSQFTAHNGKSFSVILMTLNGSVEWHLCAAYLNAATISGYALTVAEVRALANRLIGSTPVVSSSTGDTAIKEFIKQTYHA